MGFSKIIDDVLKRVEAFEARDGYLVVSLYLNTEPDQHGRDHYGVFLRREFARLAETLPLRSTEREGFDDDVRRIQHYLSEELEPSANGVAIFACSGGGFFEAIQLDVPVPENRLYLAREPQLYTLALLGDEYPRHAVLLADSSSARLFVVSVRGIRERERISNPNTNRTKMGGWSQARYQRRLEKQHAEHAREFAGLLDRVVRDEKISAIILAGDEFAVQAIREELPAHLAQKVVDAVRLDFRAPEHEVYRAVHESIRRADAASDSEKVKEILDEYRGGGLGVAGREATLKALSLGQVDELVLSTALESQDAQLTERLIASARDTKAAITFVQDASLLQAVGGVGGRLRFLL